ncbi:MAG: endolytic transglycosylase MltG [Bacteroidales bacterium]|nr:endolytic transglycosylase MltG [Bacteroidales bacterium]
MRSRTIFSRLLVGIAFFAIGGLIFVWKMFFAPVRLAQEGTEIFIGKDALYEDVKDSLRVKGILVNEAAFDLLAKRKRYVSGIKAGRYVISDDMNSNDIINLLRSGNQSPVHITFNNIRTLPDLSVRLGSQLAADSAGIHNALLDESLYSSEGFTRETIIAAFIPDTYEVYWTIRPSELIARMIREFRSFWNTERLKKAAELGLTPVEVSILASIVDDEVLKEDEKPRIAGVYLNRLRRNMPMQACPTIKFALNDFSIRRVLREHLKVNSPYNTYIHTGLPPGPVRSASKSGINAVLNAEDHNYLYFVARHDFSGYHHFSTNLRDHINYANKYHIELDRLDIYR